MTRYLEILQKRVGSVMLRVYVPSPFLVIVYDDCGMLVSIRGFFALNVSIVVFLMSTWVNFDLSSSPSLITFLRRAIPLRFSSALVSIITYPLFSSLSWRASAVACSSVFLPSLPGSC